VAASTIWQMGKEGYTSTHWTRKHCTPTNWLCGSVCGCCVPHWVCHCMWRAHTVIRVLPHITFHFQSVSHHTTCTYRLTW